MAEVRRAAATESRVDKPWGYEIRWAITPRYLGKVLHINRGEALSLQDHEQKDETLYVVSGQLDFELEVPAGGLETHRLQPGDAVHVSPGRRHRMTAVDDCDLFEVSTAEIDDVVRLEDRYGRAGH
jgi:mannose-6-phosphate isomerase-like protein (cupin superfamily)